VIYANIPIVFDSPLLLSLSSVTITVNPSYTDPPVALDDSATTAEATPVTINVIDGSAGGLDSDADGDTLTVLDGLTTNPGNGNVTFTAGESFVYTPHGNFYGRDSFVYTISDGTSRTASATGTFVLLQYLLQI